MPSCMLCKYRTPFVLCTKIDTKRGFVIVAQDTQSGKMNANNGGTPHITLDIAPDAQMKRPVGIWSKHSIALLWLLWVFELCVLICMDISIPYLALKYHPERVFNGFVVVVVANCYYGRVMSNQALDIIEASETVDDVPWWCYGCTSSTRPKERSFALWKWASAKMNRINGGSESSLELAEEAARGQRAIVLWNKNQIIRMWLFFVLHISVVIGMNIIGFYLLFKYHQREIYNVSVIM